MPTELTQKSILNENEDDDYISAEDSDFAPDKVVNGNDEISDDEDKTGTRPNKKRKYVSDTNSPRRQSAVSFENSGDEAIISKGKKRRKKQARYSDAEHAALDTDEDDGPLIKTRAMKAVEKEERKHKAGVSTPVTVDVNALWESMISEPLVPLSSSNSFPHQGPSMESQKASSSSQDEMSLPDHPKGQKNKSQASDKNEESSTITIKRTYNFAGRIITESKTVARDSAEARLWFSTQKQRSNSKARGASRQEDDQQQDDHYKIRRAFRSAFEPMNLIPSAAIRADLKLGMSSLLRTREEATAYNAKKLNTVEKSKLDWAAHVDKEGMREELELAGRRKGNFGDTQDFLARVEGRRDEEQRRVRLARKT